VLGERDRERTVDAGGIPVDRVLALFQSRRQRGVVVLPQRREEIVVERLLHLVKIEHISPARRPDQAMAPLDHGDALARVQRADAGRVGHERRIELEPQAARHIEKLFVFFGQRREPGADQAPNRGGRRQASPVATHSPCSSRVTTCASSMACRCSKRKSGFPSQRIAIAGASSSARRSER
jgi:hypothetical protein